MGCVCMMQESMSQRSNLKQAMKSSVQLTPGPLLLPNTFVFLGRDTGKGKE